MKDQPTDSTLFFQQPARSDGVVKYRYGYVGGITTKYQFEYSDPAGNEPADFTAFVASFKLVEARK